MWRIRTVTAGVVSYIYDGIYTRLAIFKHIYPEKKYLDLFFDV